MRNFWEALDEAQKVTGRSLREICVSADVDYDKLKRARLRMSKVDIGDAVKIAAELGYTVEQFVRAELIEDRAEIVAIYKSLSARERRLLRAAREEHPAPGQEDSGQPAADPQGDDEQNGQ